MDKDCLLRRNPFVNQRSEVISKKQVFNLFGFHYIKEISVPILLTSFFFGKILLTPLILISLSHLKISFYKYTFSVCLLRIKKFVIFKFNVLQILLKKKEAKSILCSLILIKIIQFVGYNYIKLLFLLRKTFILNFLSLKKNTLNNFLFKFVYKISFCFFFFF